MRGSGTSTIIAGLLYVIAVIAPAVLITASGGARAALPPDVAQSLQRAARDAQTLLADEAALANGMTDPALAAILLRRADERAGDAISAAVVGAVARYPAQNAEIIALAGSVAPRYRERIAYDIARAFPGFSGGAQAAPAIAAPTINYAYAAPTYQTPVYTPPEPAARYDTATAPLDDGAMDDFFDGGAADEIYDPFETFNRGVFWFNDQIDRFLLKPIAQAYGFITPDVAKQAIARGFDNLGAPVRFANDLLQLEFEDAGTTGARFLINSSIGIAGLFDIAADMGHEAQPSDFGQTLNAYGAHAGPYLVVPLLGPTTLRDGFGEIVDTAFDPFNYMFDTVPVNLSLKLSGGIVKREEFLQPLDDLRANSIDYYSALRGAYFQNRRTELNRGGATDSAMFDDAFAAFE